MSEQNQPTPELETPVKKTGFARLLGRKVLSLVHRNKEAAPTPVQEAKPAEPVTADVAEQPATLPEVPKNPNDSYLAVAQGTVKRTMNLQESTVPKPVQVLEESSLEAAATTPVSVEPTQAENSQVASAGLLPKRTPRGIDASFNPSGTTELPAVATTAELETTPMPAYDALNDPSHVIDSAATPMHDTLKQEREETGTFAVLRTKAAAQSREPQSFHNPNKNQVA